MEITQGQFSKEKVGPLLFFICNQCENFSRSHFGASPTKMHNERREMVGTVARFCEFQLSQEEMPNLGADELDLLSR